MPLLCGFAHQLPGTADHVHVKWDNPAFGVRIDASQAASSWCLVADVARVAAVGSLLPDTDYGELANLEVAAMNEP